MSARHWFRSGIEGSRKRRGEAASAPVTIGLVRPPVAVPPETAASPSARCRPLRAALLLVLLVAGPAEALEVVDPLGRTLHLSGSPARIVSLVPSVTEILFALGADGRLVGVTDFCDYPPEARRKPSVGGMVSPDLEMVVKLAPDLVVATAAGNREETFQQLARLGVAVYVVNPTRLDDALDLVRRLGDLTERRAPAEALVGVLRARVRAVATRVATRPRPRVLYVVWPEPLIVPGRGALVSDLIARAGGESVTAEAGSGYPRFGVEAVVARAPDVILLARHGGPGGAAARAPWTRLDSLPAARTGRIHEVDGDLFHRYGPRAVDALETLARLLHPDAFARAGPRPSPQP